MKVDSRIVLKLFFLPNLKGINTNLQDDLILKQNKKPEKLKVNCLSNSFPVLFFKLEISKLWNKSYLGEERAAKKFLCLVEWIFLYFFKRCRWKACDGSIGIYYKHQWFVWLAYLTSKLFIWLLQKIDEFWFEWRVGIVLYYWKM